MTLVTWKKITCDVCGLERDYRESNKTILKKLHSEGWNVMFGVHLCSDKCFVAWVEEKSHEAGQRFNNLIKTNE